MTVFSVNHAASFPPQIDASVQDQNLGVEFQIVSTIASSWHHCHWIVFSFKLEMNFLRCTINLRLGGGSAGILTRKYCPIMTREKILLEVGSLLLSTAQKWIVVQASLFFFASYYSQKTNLGTKKKKHELHFLPVEPTAYHLVSTGTVTVAVHRTFVQSDGVNSSRAWLPTRAWTSARLTSKNMKQLEGITGIYDLSRTSDPLGDTFTVWFANISRTVLWPWPWLL